MEADGFLPVRTSGRGRGGRRRKGRKGVATPRSPLDHLQLLTTRSEEVESQAQCILSHLSPPLLSDASPSSAHHTTPIAIVAYGIGRFTSHRPASYQFALLLALVRKLGTTPVSLFDPAFEQDELDVIGLCSGFSLISTNEECRRKITRRTLVFMPHMLAEHTQNLVQANTAHCTDTAPTPTVERRDAFNDAASVEGAECDESRDTLHHIVLVGNNVPAIEEALMQREKRAKLELLFSVLGRTTITALPSFDACERAFNDLAVHVFEPSPREAASTLKDADHGPQT